MNGFYGATDFFYNLLAYRILWIRGRLGGGKTLLSFAIADYLIRERLVSGGVIANVPHCLKLHDWREEDEEGIRGIRGAVIIFDEAWEMLDRRSFMSNPRNYGAFARKMDTIWLFPSVHPIDSRLSMFYAERTAIYTLPVFGQIWRYRWGMDTSYQRISGAFWFRPQRFFGLFDTRYIPVSDADIRLLWALTCYEMTGELDPVSAAYKPARVLIDDDSEDVVQLSMFG